MMYLVCFYVCMYVCVCVFLCVFMCIFVFVYVSCVCIQDNRPMSYKQVHGIHDLIQVHKFKKTLLFEIFIFLDPLLNYLAKIKTN